jgi:hypothetical protein
VQYKNSGDINKGTPGGASAKVNQLVLNSEMKAGIRSTGTATSIKQQQALQQNGTQNGIYSSQTMGTMANGG